MLRGRYRARDLCRCRANRSSLGLRGTGWTRLLANDEVICSIDSLSYAWLLDLARKVIELNCPFTNRHLVHGAKKAILRDISAE